MKFLRSVDSLSHSLAESQARIFENSVASGLPSKKFIRSYMLSQEVKYIDDLNLDISGISEIELFNTISGKINKKEGELFSYPVMYFIGYFYRIASYLTGYSSATLYNYIKPCLLKNNYRTLHSLPIEDAIIEVFEINNINIEDKYSEFKKLYKMDF